MDFAFWQRYGRSTRKTRLIWNHFAQFLILVLPCLLHLDGEWVKCMPVL